jgi:phenylpropionate dioxygenase-like ring-hydroxylating dioxygenase large terminal subunit
MKKACLKTYTVEEHKGLVWIWRGNVLKSDARKLPQTRKDALTYPCDTILDYNVDWQ